MKKQIHTCRHCIKRHGHDTDNWSQTGIGRTDTHFIEAHLPERKPIISIIRKWIIRCSVRLSVPVFQIVTKCIIIIHDGVTRLRTRNRKTGIRFPFILITQETGGIACMKRIGIRNNRCRHPITIHRILGPVQELRCGLGDRVQGEIRGRRRGRVGRYPEHVAHGHRAQKAEHEPEGDEQLLIRSPNAFPHTTSSLPSCSGYRASGPARRPRSRSPAGDTPAGRSWSAPG